MIAYVVTSGCCSDYGINKVFLNKEKAEKYVSLSEDCGIEEYEIADDKELYEIVYMQMFYNFTNNEKTQFNILKTNNLDKSESDIKRTYYQNINGEWIYLYRVIENKNYEEEKIKKKYEKVCQDIYAQVKYNQSQGWDKKMVNEWLETI